LESRPCESGAVSPSEKRQRQREGRSAAHEARLKALRRRRLVRLIGLTLALVAVLALSALTGRGDENGKKKGGREPAAPSVACGAEAPQATPPKQYDRAPDPASVLKKRVDYGAVIHTSCGDITMDLLERSAPRTVASFVFLAEKGFYDGLRWIRVERDFVIQAGDPDNHNGHAPDGAGYELADEVGDTEAGDYVYGTVALANHGPDTGSSQFFVVVHKGKEGDTHAAAGLSPIYTVFGKVDESSYETLERIATRETKGGSRDPVTSVEPVNPIYIDSLEITKG
jgi:peptidyl-prolyl cis-trans isomerase B (cyclophilin B)